MKRLYIFYGLLLPVLLVYSYLFVDTNLWLFTQPGYVHLQQLFKTFLIQHRITAAVLYFLLISGLFFAYWQTLQQISKRIISYKQTAVLFAFVSGFLLLSFPGFSYDVFNYIATARVAFHWKENPWVTMPADIANEPALAYTRAANKVALYGPTWVAATVIPHSFGNGQVFLSILSFKLFVFVCLLLFLYVLFRYTNNLWQTAFFAFNPLVLMEVTLGGHNDIVMMFLAATSLVLFLAKPGLRIRSILLFCLSVFVKGATLVLLPLFFLGRQKKHSLFFIGFLAMFGVFLLTPFREEMYPWYGVWWLSFLVFTPYVKNKLVYSAAAFLSFGLLLRHAPYIAMGYYEGPGPLLRIVVMSIPVIIWSVLHYKAILKSIRL